MIAHHGFCLNEVGHKGARRRPTEAALPISTEIGDFARTLGTTPLDTADVAGIEPRATHRKPKSRYETWMRMPSKLDPVSNAATTVAKRPNPSR